MKRALVTGATGFVGANLARALPKHERSVQVLVRSTDDPKALENLPDESQALRLWGDLRDFDSLKKAVKGCDEVYHVAADYRCLFAFLQHHRKRARQCGDSKCLRGHGHRPA